MNTDKHYCTYFDLRYLPSALTLYQSLKKHDNNFILWALCFDDATYLRVKELKLDGFIPLSLDEFLKDDQQLLVAKENRSLVEFYFTCSPSLPLYIFKNYQSINQITYLDADLFFFNNPEPIYREINQASIAIIPHRFPTNLQHLEENGIYNVGWLTFKRDDTGLHCLNRWRNQCLEWCFDYIEGSRFADQGYLNDWPIIYKNISIIEHKGANLAPWNLSQYRISSDGKDIWVDQDPLIFFHFQSLARIQPGCYKLNFRKYKTIPTHLIKHHIYSPYLKIIEENYKNEQNRKFTQLRNPNDQIKLISMKNIRSIISSLFRGDYMFPWDY